MAGFEKIMVFIFFPSTVACRQLLCFGLTIGLVHQSPHAAILLMKLLLFFMTGSLTTSLKGLGASRDV